MSISDVTAWKDIRVMLLATETLSVASMTWELVMIYDLLGEDEQEYLEDEPSPKVLIVDIES